MISRAKKTPYVGRSSAEAPEIDGVVYVTGENLRPGEIIPCEFVATEGYDLVAVAIGDPKPRATPQTVTNPSGLLNLLPPNSRSPSPEPGKLTMSSEAANGPSNVIWNVPNQVTALRLILSVVMFCLIPFGFYWASFVLFVLAAGTDWLDGWYARRYDQVTVLGRILDPFADKIIICGTFIFLVARTGIDGRLVRPQAVDGRGHCGT